MTDIAKLAGKPLRAVHAMLRFAAPVLKGNRYVFAKRVCLKVWKIEIYRYAFSG